MSVLIGTGDRSAVTAAAATTAGAAAAGRRARARALAGKSGGVLKSGRELKVAVVVSRELFLRAGMRARALTMARAEGRTRPRGVTRVDASGAISA